jgi:N,N-dimethylformamidase
VIDLVGYTDKLSVAPGESVSFMVSSTAPRYLARLVRLVHGDDDPRGPGVKEERLAWRLEGEREGSVQELRRGSYGIGPPLTIGPSLAVNVWVCPTTPGSREQAIVAQGDWALVLGEDGAPALRVGETFAASGQPLRAWEWYELSVVLAGTQARLSQRALRPLVFDGRADVAGTIALELEPQEAPLTIAARLVDEETREHYNGRIEDVRISSNGTLLAAWDFSLDIPTARISDTSGNEHHGRVVNMPMRAVTGHRFTGRATSWKEAPGEYGAIHFHDDDLADAGWAPDFQFDVPEDLPSGVYAAHLSAGRAEEYLPFVVRPPRDRSTAEVAFLAPTLSYLAYANEHYSWDSDFAVWAPGDVHARLTEADRYMAEHRLLSLYDFHSDGTGSCYSSYLRPILSLRPKYEMPLIAAPHQFNADLHLLDWLEAKGFQRDVLTDHDLHEDGLELLERYRVLVTGTHPEYWTERMLDGLQAYLERGGRLMYLGGNGFWWVTSIHPDAPHVIEIRRGLSGSRPWSSRPGEVCHGGTGEFGGQWRYRDRPPQRLVGVGFTSQGSDASRPYRRLPDSHDPRAAWIFEGVGDEEPIGDFGLVMGAAGGAEIDRADPSLGTPPHALVIARADGYTDMYQAQMDDTLFHDSRQGGTQSPLVRADMVFFEAPCGGAVFAPGSISWCGSLSFSGYDNNVSRITENVLRRFLDAEPFPSPPSSSPS